MALEEELVVLHKCTQTLCRAFRFVDILRWKKPDPVELFDDPVFRKPC